MNISIDERTKHRLTGLVVIVAVAIIFVPAMLKKSNQHLEKNMHVAVKLPPKPTLPNVTIAKEEEIFETVKVAKLELPKPIEPAQPSQLARIENLTPKKPQVIEAKPVKTKIQAMQKASPASVAAEAYAVQLAVFSVQKNAEKLVAKLRNQGYKARYQTLTSNTGMPTYRVTVGHLEDRKDAHALKDKLSETTNIKGFIIKRDMG